eukprot:GHVU01016756.1.p1 GENE.GHVU01016756.1~~GHVU01016756.1.p1  ORF type:complete len:259 (-),score=39.33 GHVU01016756.1:441-1217(-)
MSAPAALVPESRAEQPLPVCGSEVTMLREKEEKEQRRGVMMSLITEFFPNEEESDLEGILFNPETRVFLFQAEDGVVVGLATVERMKRTGQDEKTETSAYYLHHLCVRDEWQRKGVARKICGAMAEAARTDAVHVDAIVCQASLWESEPGEKEEGSEQVFSRIGFECTGKQSRLVVRRPSSYFVSKGRVSWAMLVFCNPVGDLTSRMLWSLHLVLFDNDFIAKNLERQIEVIASLVFLLPHLRLEHLLRTLRQHHGQD